MRVDGVDYWLEDDGTLDTVIGVSYGDYNLEFRYSQEFASEYRDEDTGYLRLGQFLADVVINDLVTLSEAMK